MKAKYVRVRSPKGAPNIVHKYKTEDRYVTTEGLTNPAIYTDLGMNLPTDSRGYISTAITPTGEVYLFGGGTSSSSNNYGAVHKLDLVNKRLNKVRQNGEELDYVPCAMYGKSVVHGNKIYMMGGYYNTSEIYSMHIIDLNPVDSVVSSEPSYYINDIFQVSRIGAGVVNVGRKILTFGGVLRENMATASVGSTSIRIYDIDTNKWSDSAYTLSNDKTMCNAHYYSLGGSLGGYIYVLGGNRNNIDKFTVDASGNITASATLSINDFNDGSRYWTNSVLIGDNIYVWKAPHSGSSTLVKFSCLTDAIDVDATALLAAPTMLVDGKTRTYASMVTYNNKIYLIGGLGFNSIDEYDTDTNTWTTLGMNSIPGGYEALKTPNATTFLSPHRRSFTIGSYGYITGGYDITNNVPTNAVLRFDPSTDTWETHTSLNKTRHIHNCQVVNAKAYVFGGISYDGDTASIEEYNPDTEAWTTKNANLITPRVFSNSFVYNDKIYIVGGLVEEEYTNSVEIYDPINDTISVAPFTLSLEFIESLTSSELTGRYSILCVVNSVTKTLYMYSAVSGYVEVINLETNETIVSTRDYWKYYGRYEYTQCSDVYYVNENSALFFGGDQDGSNVLREVNLTTGAHAGSVSIHESESYFTGGILMFLNNYMYAFSLNRAVKINLDTVVLGHHVLGVNSVVNMKKLYSTDILAKKPDVATDKATVEAVVIKDYNAYVDPLVPLELTAAGLDYMLGYRNAVTVIEKTTVARTDTMSPELHTALGVAMAETEFKAFDISLNSTKVSSQERTPSISNWMSNDSFRGVTNASEY